MTPVTTPMISTSIRARCMKEYCSGSVNHSMMVMTVLPAEVLVLMVMMGAVVHCTGRRAEDDDRPAEGLREVLGRVHVDRRAVADHALADAEEAVACPRGADEVVAREQDDFVRLPLLLDDLEHDLLRAGVDAGHRLVEEEDVGVLG